MSSLTETTKRSKKTKRLGPARIIRAEQYEGFDVETKVACIQALIPLGLMQVQAVLEEEVCTLAGARYARKTPEFPGRRHGSNPGSIRLAGQQVPFPIPRVREADGEEEIPLATLSLVRQQGLLDEVLLKRVTKRDTRPLLKSGNPREILQKLIAERIRPVLQDRAAVQYES